ncbi:CoA ester lyase [Sphingomonas sp. CL5.1]|nr:CoA ester lyase [Sphingomonas sp. CL5.1]
MFTKAMAGAADAVILDLEDAVPPAGKPVARAAVADWLLANADDAAKPVFVRINDGELGLEDVEALVASGAAFAGLLVPKAETGGAIRCLGVSLDAAGPRLADVALQPIIESVAGLYALAELAAASRRVGRFSFGAGDFVADLGGVATPERTETLIARAEIAMRSRLLGLAPPVAHVFAPIADLTALRRACVEDRALGFGARSCIHPSQVEVVNASFGISEAELRKAREIVARSASNQAGGAGAFQMPDGTFVDEAVVRQARAILAQAPNLPGAKGSR